MMEGFSVDIKTKIFGHRGYPKKFAENSLEGFAYCVKNGAEGIEFDVHLTKDQVPVVIHDEKVDRTTDQKGLIKDMTLAQVKACHLQNGESIPTLTEVLAILKTYPGFINLEFKTDKQVYPGLVEKVLYLAQDFPQIIYSSFNLETLRQALAFDATLDCNYLVDFEVENPQKLLQENRLKGLHPHLWHDFSGVQRIWTIDDELLAQKLMQKGVSGLFTNDFEKMNRLKERMKADA